MGFYEKGVIKVKVVSIFKNYICYIENYVCVWLLKLKILFEILNYWLIIGKDGIICGL